MFSQFIFTDTTTPLVTLQYIIDRSCLILCIISTLTIPALSQANSFKKLLMPGPVVESHKELEEDCDQCHDTNSKEKQGRLCIQCHTHENILDDLSSNSGFHGRLPNSIRTNCKHCHTEHKGRDKNIILFNPLTFDHSRTDFRLEGFHKKLQCESCHKKDKKYPAAPSSCYACHKNDDAHNGKQGKKCGECHSALNWKQSAFDHDKKTDFPLKGAHKKTLCSSCHINKEYKDTPDKCVSCHKIQDIHQNSFGRKCDSCHDSKKWDSARFDHSKTDFKLRGKHKKTSCQSCHIPGKAASEAPSDCHSCHKNDDSHKGQYGKKCDSCHRPASWQKSTFDHEKSTEFPLTGNHSSAACVYCHRGNPWKEELATDCYSCHKANDVHDGKNGKQCDNCHSTRSWRGSTNFDHDLSEFPLIGMHATIQCEECHLSRQFSATGSECNACHEDDDTHETRLGTDCGICHNPNSWQTWIFDHNKSTAFELDGAHEDIGCYDCHSTRSGKRPEASSDCISCHRNDDKHDGQFGRQCTRCHSTDSFSDIDIN